MYLCICTCISIERCREGGGGLDKEREGEAAFGEAEEMCCGSVPRITIVIIIVIVIIILFINVITYINLRKEWVKPGDQSCKILNY